MESPHSARKTKKGEILGIGFGIDAEVSEGEFYTFFFAAASLLIERGCPFLDEFADEGEAKLGRCAILA